MKLNERVLKMAGITEAMDYERFKIKGYGTLVIKRLGNNKVSIGKVSRSGVLDIFTGIVSGVNADKDKLVDILYKYFFGVNRDLAKRIDSYYR